MESVARYASRRPMPAAVVADVASQGGLAAIRLLDRAGVPVLALDHRPDAVGFRSRRALALHAPPPDDPRFVPLLLELAAALGRRTVLLPTSASYLSPLAASRDRLAEGFHCTFPGADSARAVAALGTGAGNEPATAVAFQFAADGALVTAFCGGPIEDEFVDTAADALRVAGAAGSAWVELSPTRIVAAGAHLWPGHAEAARSGTNLPRIAYWTALGARLPNDVAGSTSEIGRAPGLADPGPALAATVGRFRRRR